jgi:bifunctional DNA-binding transcriptional regulator/antitoxin component of YhaV-PrlF toxin-antitoxin module
MNLLTIKVKEMEEITIITKATSKGKSLRTTIPIGIVKQFNLSKGDKLNWEIRAESGELIIMIRPFKGEKE